MIAALVCGRAEHQPFPGRNTFPLLGRPLMVYPLLAAANSREVRKVFLSTDNPHMALIARHHGAEVIHRPPELRAAEVTLESIIEQGYAEITSRLDKQLEALVVLLCHAPTVTSDLIDQGIKRLRDDSSLDAVMTVSRHHEFHPSYALKLSTPGGLQPYLESIPADGDDVYFPDALLWILRPSNYFQGGAASALPNYVVNPRVHRVAALVHEGYGDVDYMWQIPAIEEWLRRRGFTEEVTPYVSKASPAPEGTYSPAILRPSSSFERRVLITTVPFGQQNRRPLDLLEADAVDYVINPLGRRLKEEELAKMIGDFGILIAGTEPITARVMGAAPHLRLISRVGIGLDNVDLVFARRRGIHVAYTPDAPSAAVSELTIGLMLSLLRGITGADRSLRNGVWHRFMGQRLAKMTVGVIGVGRVGKRVVQHLAGGFPGVRILANDLEPDLEFGRAYPVQWTDKEHVYREADIITLHLPLTLQTLRLIGVQEIEKMKPTALLINTSRGNIVDESDLAKALRTGWLGGAAIDVFSREPYSGELSTLDRCILTCHMGSMTQDCRHRMELEATEEVIRFVRNEPLQCLVPDTEYLAVE